MGKRCQGRLSWLFTQDYLCCSDPVASRTGTLRPALQLPTPHVELGLHKGSQTALWVVQNWGFDLVQNCELGYLSRDVQISWLKHRLSGPSQCLCGIWFQSKLNKNNEITHVRIFHELGAALTREAADGVCEASSSPGLYLWDNHGTGQVLLECPLLRQPGLTGSSLALLFASLTCGLVQGCVEETLLPSPWCSAPRRFEGEASPFSPGSHDEVKQGGSSSLPVGLAGPSMQISHELACAKGCLWPAGAVAHWCPLLGWTCCTTFQRPPERKLSAKLIPCNSNVPLNDAS